MATKVISTRIRLRRGTTAEWEANPSFVPLDSEPIVYSDYRTIIDTNGDSVVIPGLKIGDGVRTVAELPFIDAGFSPSSKDSELNLVYCDSSANTPEGVEFGNVVGALVASATTLNKIYLVPSVNDINDVYDEYITVRSINGSYSWERLGGLDASNIVAKKLSHTLTFGNNGEYRFDGSADVTVPSYDGKYSTGT